MIKKYISIVFILCMMSAGFSQTKPDTDLPWSEVAPKRNKNTKKEKAQNNGRENTEKQKPPAAGKKENKAAPGSRRSDTGRKQSVNGTENSSAVKQTPPAEKKRKRQIPAKKPKQTRQHKTPALQKNKVTQRFKMKKTPLKRQANPKAKTPK